MPNRTRTVASAVFATCLANAILIAVTFGTANAVDDCQSAPKGAASGGGHWYYRTDHKTNRKCWYVSDEQPEHVTPKKDASSSRPPADAKLDSSTANAHAELVGTAPTQQPSASAASPKPVQTTIVAPDQPLPDSQAFLRTPAQPDANATGDHDIVVADDSVNVNVDPPEPAARVDAAPATVGQAATAPAVTQTAATPTAVTQTAAVNPLRTVLGWTLIALGALIVAGCLVVKFMSGIRIERRDPIGT